MMTVFIEYKLVPEKRKQALALIAEIEARMTEQGASQFRCFEGYDQPDLFVETFDVDHVEQYEQIKQDRLSDEAFCDCIAGGSSKLNIWAFCPVKR
ncbi:MULTISPECIES: hypothetical protein [Brevibacillus]|uniref:ABM domain-containing protein n=1 Tax=Brevibacillus invocatus TaxID=173959 RepID=A0A3M8CG01_9BACL|nr:MULTISPECIES: hypothetical protein [Brevibacillus]MCM3080369.1 hypothetical protein [Brevibacillus invocatus]MCM3430550.1 hypothetical protein [Brevibacillus invocatus]MDH4616433.1 hypothetical protein [Brevibacillus sp. AY1]RNB74421.1 hypothetical protein EDM52_12225 [Brevibacillus invocatus]